MVLSLQIVARAEPSAEAKNLFKRAMDFNNKKDYGTALNYFMKAYQMSPEILSADDQGLLDNATSFLKARVAQDPGDAENHFQLAEMFVLRGINEEASKHYKKVIEIAPGGPLALLSKNEISKINTNIQQVQAQTVVAEANYPTYSAADQKADELQERVESLQKEIIDLKERLKQIQSEEKEKFKKYEDMEKDYKQLQKDSALWKLSYTRHMSLGGGY